MPLRFYGGQVVSGLGFCIFADDRHELVGEWVKQRELSGQRGQSGQDFVLIRLESSGRDCTMGAGSRENSVYSAYTPQCQLGTVEDCTRTQTRLRSTGTALPIACIINREVAVAGAATTWAAVTLGPAYLFQGLFTLQLRPVLLKQLRQAHAWLKLYRIHRHDRSPVRDPGDSMPHPVAHHVSLAEHSC